MGTTPFLVMLLKTRDKTSKQFEPLSKHHPLPLKKTGSYAPYSAKTVPDRDFLKASFTLPPSLAILD